MILPHYPRLSYDSSMLSHNAINDNCIATLILIFELFGLFQIYDMIIVCIHICTYMHMFFLIYMYIYNIYIYIHTYIIITKQINTCFQKVISQIPSFQATYGYL